MLLKRKIGPTIVAIGAVVEAVCKGRGSGSLGRRRSFRIGHELASILPRFPHFPSHDFCHDRPRSWPDRASIGC